MKYKNGEEFLNKIFKEMHKSLIVEHTAKKSDTPSKKIERYMNRLDNIHKKADTEQKKDLVKKLYHEKYVIKRNNLVEYFLDEEIDEIILEQKERLDIWIDYLTSDDNRYPMWAKYWAFQGMLKIGNYDNEKETYDVRSERTTAPFIELNPEILGTCMEAIVRFVNDEEINDKEIASLIASGNFKKIYTTLINKKKNNFAKTYEGKWVKYSQGNFDDAMKLYESLQGYNTGWCTAGSIYMVKDQVCGGMSYPGGDFYVYYTKDEKGEYKVPRIAIRMDGKKYVGEIRGIDKYQNLEEGLEEILITKINSIELDENDRINMIKAANNIREIVELYKKVNNNEELTREEILFIFQKNINTFGWKEDFRITKIRDKVVIDDYNLGLEVIKENVIGINYISDNLKKNSKFMMDVVKIDGNTIEYIDRGIDNYIEIALMAIKQNSEVLFIKIPEDLRNNREFILKAVMINPKALEHVSHKFRNDEEIVFAAIKQGGSFLEYASYELKNNPSFVMRAVLEDPGAILYISEELKENQNFRMTLKQFLLEEQKKKTKNR